MRAVRARLFWTRRRLRDRYEEWAWTTTEPLRRRFHTAYRGWIVARAARADVRSATSGAMRPPRTGLRRATGAAAVLLATAGVAGAVAVSQDGSPNALSQFAPAEPREAGDGRVESVVNATEEGAPRTGTRPETERRRTAVAATASAPGGAPARADGDGDDAGVPSDTPSAAPAPGPRERTLTRTSPGPRTGGETLVRQPRPAPAPTPVEPAPAPAPPEPAPVAPVETGNPNGGGGGTPPKEDKVRPVRGPKAGDGL